MSNLIKLIEPNSGECLFETNDFESAYQKALELEQMGIEIKVVSPSAPASLAALLGASSDDLEILKTIIDSEIDHYGAHLQTEDRDLTLERLRLVKTLFPKKE
jgi:hypothetical protein